MTGDAYVVFTHLADSSALGMAAALAVVGVLLGLWFAWPVALRQRRNVSGAALDGEAR